MRRAARARCVSGADGTRGPTAGAGFAALVATAALAAVAAPGVAGCGGGDCGIETCTETEFCAWDDYACGTGAYSPICRARPLMCMNDSALVCACDGTTYPNPCEAAIVGQDVDATGGCATPAGAFPCGPFFCDLATEYCRFVRGMFEADEYLCRALPPGCAGAPSCGCLAAETCPGPGLPPPVPVCSMPPSGGLRLDCS